MNLANKEYSETEENIQIDLKDYIINDEDGYIICDRFGKINIILLLILNTNHNVFDISYWIVLLQKINKTSVFICGENQRIN